MRLLDLIIFGGSGFCLGCVVGHWWAGGFK
jgi:hypothetical protein